MDLTGTPVVPRLRTVVHRPYARKRKGPVSITTALGVLNTPLEWGASKEAAIFATKHRSELARLSDDDAIDRIRRHFRGVWDGRAAVGTVVHAVNEAWTWGETADLSELVTAAAHADRYAVKIWQGHEEETIASVGTYVDGLAAFWGDFAPVTLATEEVVRDSEAPYIGQRDWVVESRGRRLLVEIKTTAQQDADKGLYWDTWRLQLAAQRFAPEIVAYDAKGTEQRTYPNYPVDAACVLHLRGDGGYHLYEVQAGPDEHAQFLALVAMHGWLNGPGKNAPVVDLTPVKEASAA